MNNNEIIITVEGDQKIDELLHYGIKGQKHGQRRFQYPDGSLTPEGRIRYGYDDDDDSYDDEGNNTDSEDAKKVKAIRAKSSSERSNKEIQAANERQRLQNENLRLQKENEDLTKQPSKFERFKNNLKDAAEITNNLNNTVRNAKSFIKETFGSFKDLKSLISKKSDNPREKSEKELLDEETNLLKSKASNMEAKNKLEALLAGMKGESGSEAPKDPPKSKKDLKAEAEAAKKEKERILRSIKIRTDAMIEGDMISPDMGPDTKKESKKKKKKK